MRVSPERLKRILLTLAVFASAALFAACGSDDDGGNDPDPDPDPEEQGERADTLHGGSSKSWQLLEAVGKISANGQTLFEQDLTVGECFFDDAFVFTAAGADLLQIEGAVPCGSRAEGDTLRTTGYAFVEGAEEKLVVTDGLLEGFDLVSDTMNVAQLTPTRLALYEQIDTTYLGFSGTFRAELTLTSP